MVTYYSNQMVMLMNGESAHISVFRNDIHSFSFLVSDRRAAYHLHKYLLEQHVVVDVEGEKLLNKDNDLRSVTYCYLLVLLSLQNV